MKLNKIVLTKNLERELIVVQFTPQEFDDVHSALTMASRVAKKEHRDSPNFRRALERLENKWSRTLADVRNREKQAAK